MERDDPVERWSRLVTERLDQMAVMDPERGRVGPGFWDGRARRFADQMGDGRRDPLWSRLVRRVGPATTVLDVGAGAGRFAVPLASRAARVTALDPSPRMLGQLRRLARQEGVAPVTVVGTFPDVEVEPADVTVCSYVLPVVADAGEFVAGLDRVTLRRAFVYMAAMSTDALVDPFWRHFHGRPRKLGPTYLDARDLVGVVTGVVPDVEVVEVAVRTRFDTPADAVRRYSDWLLVDGDRAAARDLRTMLGDWLVADGRGRLRPPLASMPAAILSWSPPRR